MTKKPDLRTILHVWKHELLENQTINEGRPNEYVSNVERYVARQNPRLYVELIHEAPKGEDGWRQFELDYEAKDGTKYILGGDRKFGTPLEACAPHDYFAFNLHETTALPSDVRSLTTEEKAVCDQVRSEFEKHCRPKWDEEELAAVPPTGQRKKCLSNVSN